MKKIAITMGDPNSIAPEITVKALNFLDLPKESVILISNKNILEYYDKHYHLSLEKEYDIMEIPYEYSNIIPGKETEEAGEFSFRALRLACDLASSKTIDAIVTAPVSKNAINIAGHNYSGQTEILEQYLASSNQQAQMLFICDNFSTMLLTRHIALKDVSNFITKDFIVNKIRLLKQAFSRQLGMENPRFAICALNPHSGENGLLGDEEQYQIIPAVQELQKTGINIAGPFPADTLFIEAAKSDCPYDCFISMYHDQGLIPIKLLARYNSVNTTVGLNVIRTSPAHGTAFDIAGKIIANPDSMINAIKFAFNKINL